jgi:hypothetical protein
MRGERMILGAFHVRSNVTLPLVSSMADHVRNRTLIYGIRYMHHINHTNRQHSAYSDLKICP